MSKEAVRRSMSERFEIDPVKDAAEKEQAQKEQEASEAAAATKRSFAKLLDDARQLEISQKKKAESAADKKKQTSCDAQEPAKKIPEMIDDGESANMKWARHLDSRDNQMRSLIKQVTNLQEVVQKLEGCITSMQGITGNLTDVSKNHDKEINELKKEQVAEAETMELIVRLLNKM